MTFSNALIKSYFLILKSCKKVHYSAFIYIGNSEKHIASGEYGDFFIKNGKIHITVNSVTYVADNISLYKKVPNLILGTNDPYCVKSIEHKPVSEDRDGWVKKHILLVEIGDVKAAEQLVHYATQFCEFSLMCDNFRIVVNGINNWVKPTVTKTEWGLKENKHI